jgi:hypothetical protein
MESWNVLESIVVSNLRLDVRDLVETTLYCSYDVT